MNIRVATLNAWALPEPLADLVPERMRAIGSEIANLDLDLLAFQEVWTPDARRTLRRAGQRAGLPHAWIDSAPFGGSGLAVLSRHPIRKAHVERFSLPHVPSRPDHPDYYVGKGFVSLIVSTPHGALRAIATHLHARYGGDVAHEYRAYRAGQIVELATALRRTHEPTVMLGDFNLRETDVEYPVLRGLTGLRDAAVETLRREPTVDGRNPFRRPGRTPKRIDYIFLRDGRSLGLRVASLRRSFDALFQAGGRTASFSNHAGLLAELELHDAPRPGPRPDPSACGRAATLLAEGRARTESQRKDARVAASAGWAGALLATLSARDTRVSRRAILRKLCQFGGLAALAPGIGFSLVAEVFTPGEIQAFDQLIDRLHGLSR